MLGSEDVVKLVRFGRVVVGRLLFWAQSLCGAGRSCRARHAGSDEFASCGPGGTLGACLENVSIVRPVVGASAAPTVGQLLANIHLAAENERYGYDAYRALPGGIGKV